MRIHRLAFNLGVASLAGLVVLLFSLAVLDLEPKEGTLAYLLAQSAGGFLSLLVGGCGFFLWITGFNRFRAVIGSYGVVWLSYVTFTILSGFYMEYRYGGDLGNS